MKELAVFSIEDPLINRQKEDIMLTLRERPSPQRELKLEIFGKI